MTESVEQERFTIGDWRADRTTGILARGDEEVRLEPKVMSVLVELAAADGRVVSKEELIERVWPEAFVGEAALARCISELRRALGDDAREPRYVETLPKRGYRLLVPVGTPEPERVGGDAGDPDAPPPAGRRVTRNRVVAALVVAALFVAWWMGRPAPAEDTRIESLAVLPLRAASEDAAARFLAEGLTQQLVAELASIEGLSVRAAEASRASAGDDRPLAEVARDLGVDAVVAGTVQVSGNRTLIGLELVHVASRDDLWAGSFQEIDEDPLEIEREVARHATREIAATLAARNGAIVSRIPRDPQARRALERGLVLAGRDRPADALRALEHYREALRIEPDYALAWAAIADLQATLGWNHWSPVAEAYGEARTAAYRALDLAPRLPEAHAALGAIAAEANWDWPEAERFFRGAAELGADSAMAQERYARHLRRLGRYDEALARSRRAVEVDPEWLTAQVSHGWSLLLADREDEAEATFLRAIEMDDNIARGIEGLCAVGALRGDGEAAIATCRRAAAAPGHDHLLGALGFALALSGQTRRAEVTLDDLREVLGTGATAALAEATALLGLDRRAEAIEALERAVEGRVIGAAAVLADPYLRQLAGEPGFEDLLERMAIPRSTGR